MNDKKEETIATASTCGQDRLQNDTPARSGPYEQPKGGWREATAVARRRKTK